MNTRKVQEVLKNLRNTGTQRIDLTNCGLTQIPKEIFEYPDIVTIDVSNIQHGYEEYKNKITVIPDKIANLKNLRRLNVANNKVYHISEKLSTLTNLKYLNLENNNLKELSEKIANMQCLGDLLLNGNPFDMLPPEIVMRGIKSIRNFFKELEEKDYLYEVKLIIVGEGRVGKTCLSKALIDDNYQLEDEPSTEGINISRWLIPQAEISKINPKIKRDFQINIWDFGGQEIYHSTHQFFLTKRSIYMLVTESRKEDSNDDFFYWLNIIKLLGHKSPVVMVLNKCDQPTKELPIKEYQSHFDNIKDFHKISLKPNYSIQLQDFKKEVTKIAASLPHIGNPLPKVWVDIRRELEGLKLAGKNYISIKEYLEICKKHYRRENSALFLSEYFHDLGVILHFKDDFELKDTVILNHEWITSGVYKILDDKKVINQKGRFANTDIDRIWSNTEYKDKKRELISLMKNRKFDLCFEIDNGEYLVPRLLPVDEIEHDWEVLPENTKFEFQYKFMPKGILARLIVKLSNDIYENKYWRYGVILQYGNTKAIVKEKYFDNKITIEINGDSQREYLFLIKKAIKEIHKDFSERLLFDEMIPCNCPICRNIEKPHFYKYDLLIKYEQKGRENIICEKSLEEVNVASLTNNIKREISTEKVIACENKNAELLNNLDFKELLFFGEQNSSDVFVSIKTRTDRFGLRDRDFLIDEEIIRLQEKHSNYFILDYYCFENYLYHPDNLDELEIENFQKENYEKEIIKQKNEKKHQIMSIFKKARDGYKELRIYSNLKLKKENENEVIKYLESDEIEIFFKAFSMKDYFNKQSLSKYQLTEAELASTEWFRQKFEKILKIK